MTEAEQRRSIILEVIKERGPCLSNFLHAMVEGRMQKFVTKQLVLQDIYNLRKSGKVKVARATGLVPSAHSKMHGQKMIIVSLSTKVIS